MKTTIRIANPEDIGKKYTSVKRAREYLSRNAAILTEAGELFFIVRRSSHVSSYDAVNGSFEWTVGESGGFQVMKADHLDSR